VLQLLEAQGYTKIHSKAKGCIEVLQDRVRISSTEKSRVMDALEAAMRVGQGRVNVYPETDPKMVTVTNYRFSANLHCADCDIHYAEATPAAFSFNSPIGACDACRGFGRVIGVDFGLVVPDESKTLRQGAVRPWQSPSFKECQDDLEKYAKKRRMPLDVPFRDLTQAQKTWVLEGEPEWVSWR
jgi:excinuclease ABC subunit A